MSDHQADRLDGWKAIADYLARDQRTVQRWAKTRGLPIHHLHGGKGGSVSAGRGELDEWLAGTGQSSPSPSNVPSSVHVIPPKKVLPPEIRWRPLTVGIPAVILAIAAAIALVARWSEARFPESVDVVGNAVVAQAEGRVLWRYALGQPTDAPPDATWGSSSPVAVRYLDLNHDDVPEIPILLTLARGGEQFVRNEFLLLSIEGELLWRYTPEASLRFGTEAFDGPWRIEKWMATDGPAGPLVWLSVIHHVWWPSFIVTIDATGQATTRFVHPGHIYSLASVTNDTGSYVVAAGINNEYSNAMLAVLDQNGQAAAAPSADARYRCECGPHEEPVRYVLFPQSELSSLLNQPYNRVYDAALVKDRLELSVQEVSQPHLRAVYQLSKDFVPERVGLSDAYWQAHRGLEREGRLDHAAEECPDRAGMKVRMWEPEEGWSERMVIMSGGD